MPERGLMAQAFSQSGEQRQRGSAQQSLAQTLAAHGLDAIRFVQRALEHAVRPRSEASRQLAEALRGANPALASRVESRLPARISSESHSFAPDHGHSSQRSDVSTRPFDSGHSAVPSQGGPVQTAHGHEYQQAGQQESRKRKGQSS